MNISATAYFVSGTFVPRTFVQTMTALARTHNPFRNIGRPLPVWDRTAIQPLLHTAAHLRPFSAFTPLTESVLHCAPAAGALLWRTPRGTVHITEQHLAVAEYATRDGVALTFHFERTAENLVQGSITYAGVCADVIRTMMLFHDWCGCGFPLPHGLQTLSADGTASDYRVTVAWRPTADANWRTPSPAQRELASSIVAHTTLA